MTIQAVKANPTLKTRRVVTGHNGEGRSVIVSDSSSSVNSAILHEDFVVNEIWRSDALPADNTVERDPCLQVELEPSSQGNVFRIVQIPPDELYLANIGSDGTFPVMGESGAASLSGYDGAPHPLMHRSHSVDYIVVISGEIYAVMEEGETKLRQGDVLVQRGTNHAWSNRSDKPCVMAAILNAARPITEERS